METTPRTSVVGRLDRHVRPVLGKVSPTLASAR
jgi:hypothetical protein